MSWQLAGAALLMAWVVTACALDASGSAWPFGGRTTAQAPAPTKAGVAHAGAERQLGAMIESGLVTHIERIVVTAPSHAVDEVAIYRVVVRLENGASHEFTEPSLGELKVGDHVQVVRSGSDPTT